MEVYFNRPRLIGNEKKYIQEVLESSKFGGDGAFTKKCSKLQEEKFNAKKVLLTTSCTHALEMAALVIGLKEGDEVIMPSFTFPSTANAVCLRGAIPVFSEIRKDTLNIDENRIEEKITKKTKAIFVMHYAGVSCEMDKIMDIAKKHDLIVIEDAAQGVNALYKGRFLGTIGHIGAYSFHETKNYVCGEGGAIVINNEGFIEKAEIIREKGTNRSQFLRGEIDKYSWVDIGSSYLPSEIVAAFLYAQLESMDIIDAEREAAYRYYIENLKPLEEEGKIKLPSIPKHCKSNYHLFHIFLKDEGERNALMDHLRRMGIQATFHYVPLHTSIKGQSLGYKKGDLPVTEEMSARLLRLPFFFGITREEQDYVVRGIKKFFESFF